MLKSRSSIELIQPLANSSSWAITLSVLGRTSVFLIGEESWPMVQVHISTGCVLDYFKSSLAGHGGSYLIILALKRLRQEDG
jgi:hypothetical protein